MATELTVAQLEKMLEAKKSRLMVLLRQRDQLRKQLAVVSDKIAAVGGEAAPRTPAGLKRRKRPKNDKTLLQVVLEVLGDNKKGLSLSDLSAKVLEAGYKTGSAAFSNTVYQCLYHNGDQIAYDSEARLYRLK